MREKVKEIIADTIGVEPTDVEEESLLQEDLGIGGAEMSEILEKIHEEFDTEISPTDVGDVESVEEFLDLIETYAQEEF